VFGADYELPSIEDHNTAMWDNGYLPNVGPTLDGAPLDVADKMGRMLNELEHAHIYIGQLHDQNLRQQQEIASLKAEKARNDAQAVMIDDLIARLAIVESKP